MTLVATVLFLLSVLALVFATFDVMCVGTLMALDAIVEFADTFFDVFATNVVGRVFMTAVAVVAAVVVAHMAGDTSGVVVAVEEKVFVVVKRCGCPLFLGMALNAIAGNLLM